MDNLKYTYKRSNYNFEFLLFGLTVLFSILSQINDEEIIVLTRPLMYGSWLLMGCYLAVKLQFDVKLRSFGLVLISGYTLFWLVTLTTTLFGNNHLNAGLISPFTISVGSYFVGVLLHHVKFTPASLGKVFIIFVVCVLLLALQIRLTFFTSLSAWMSEMTYGYGRKNSAGQLIGLASLILLFYFTSKKPVYIIIRLAMLSVLLYVLLLVQSRGALLAFVAACLAGIFLKKRGRIMRLSIFVLSAVILYTNQTFKEIIEKAFFIKKYAGTDINTFSSGRIDLWEQALHTFSLNPFFGTGSYYVDNFYVNVLTEQGIVGASIIFPIVFTRMILNFRMKIHTESSYSEQNLYLIIKLFTVFYLVESLLEGFPPLGPGVCAFLFWLLAGYLDMRNKEKAQERLNSENQIKQKTYL